MPVKPGPANRASPSLTEEQDPAARRSHCDPKLFTIAGRCGRLGNRLIIFAQFIAFAEEHGHRLINFTFHSYAGFFESTRRDIYCQYPRASRTSWLDAIPGANALVRKTRICYHATRAASSLNERLHLLGRTAVTLRESPGRETTLLEGPEVQDQIRDAKIVFVNGFNFHAPRCVRRHADKIRSYFQPIEEYQQASRQAVERLRQDTDVVVGVHIRQGDYRGWRGGKSFFPISRYAAWMNEMAEQFSRRKVSFLVCSDEPRNSQEFPGLRVGFGANSPMGDLYALAECDFIFGPPSTFSKWASFYGNKPVFHLRNNEARLEREKFRVSFIEHGLGTQNELAENGTIGGEEA